MLDVAFATDNPMLVTISESSKSAPLEATLNQALIPVFLLVVLLGSSVYLFGTDSSTGPNQIALILCTAVAIVIGIRNGHKWKDLEVGISRGISVSMGSILILLVVGSVIGAWMLAGVVPTMIYYGLSLISPSVFYPASCVICAVAALAIGSSWTTAGTIGVALIGIATVQDLNLGLAAGAVVSGSYFGDKMSPLSDTTNLAPAAAGTDLFAHIRHMLWTTVPSFLIALILFTIVGFFGPSPKGTDELGVVQSVLLNHFSIGPHLLVPMLLVFVLVIFRMPAFPALLIGALAGGVFAVIFQQDVVLRYVGATDLPKSVALIKGVWQVLYAGYRFDSGNIPIDELLSRGGMASMLMTVWLILTAMMFGAVMEVAGMLQVIAKHILRTVSGTGSLIAATLATSFGMNVIASDQYIAIVLPGRMFRREYERRGLALKNLSRTLEDSGTLTSALIPWNTCGAYMATTLGVQTLTYAPFAFFNLLSPLVAGLYGFANIKVASQQQLPEERTTAE